MAHGLCCNCRSRRGTVKKRGRCSKCYYWQRKIEKNAAILEMIRAKSGAAREWQPSSLLYGMRVARRVLEELKWREQGLERKTLIADRLEALVCELARDYRSKVPENTSVLIGKMSPRARRQIFEVLLTVVEHLPRRRPTLHSLDRPAKGAYYGGGWMDWQTALVASKEFHDNVMLGRELERAYYEGLQGVSSA
jgi:hypothetical protein